MIERLQNFVMQDVTEQALVQEAADSYGLRFAVIFYDLSYNFLASPYNEPRFVCLWPYL